MANSRKSHRGDGGRYAETNRNRGPASSSNRGNSLRGITAMYEGDYEEDERDFSVRAGRGAYAKSRVAALLAWDDEDAEQRKRGRASSGR